MTATIVRFDRAVDIHDQDQRLLEFVLDLSGAPSGVAAAAFQDAPSTAAPLERVAHALVRLRRVGGLRIAAYVPDLTPPPGRAVDLVSVRTLRAGSSWPGGMRTQVVRSRRMASTDD